VIPFKAFSNMEGDDVRGILFSANETPGSFRFAIDDVRLRPATSSGRLEPVERR
jgi:hypothetical protein